MQLYVYAFFYFDSTKSSYRDVTMHALLFASRGIGITLKQECSTCDEERGEGKGEIDHWPLISANGLKH